MTISYHGMTICVVSILGRIVLKLGRIILKLASIVSIRRRVVSILACFALTFALLPWQEQTS
jgi:hypothetical protein